MSRTIVLTDLDDTLFSSERTPVSACAVPAAVNRTGATSSYASRPQQLLVEMIERADFVIPVTGRTSRGLKKQSLIGRSELAVVSHGGWILNGEMPLQSWAGGLYGDSARVENLLSIARNSCESALAEHGVDDARIHISEEDGVAVYLSIKVTHEITSSEKEILKRIARDFGLECHVGHRNAAILGPHTSKARAVEHLLKTALRRSSDDLVIGLGDSCSDVDFMNLCDFAILPTRSQVWDHLLQTLEDK